MNYNPIIVESKKIDQSNIPNQQGSYQIPINSLKEKLTNWKKLSVYVVLLSPGIYFPIIAFFLILIIAFVIRKFYFKQ